MELAEHERLDALRFFQLTRDRLMIRVLVGEDQETQIHLFTSIFAEDGGRMYKFTYSSFYDHRLEYTETNTPTWSELTGETAGQLLREWVIEPDWKVYRRGWLTTKQIAIIVKSRLGPAEATENISVNTLLDFGRLQEQLSHESAKDVNSPIPKVFLKRLERFLSDYTSDIQAAARRLAGLSLRK